MEKIAEQPLISVLMPAYNAEQYIGEAIKTILNQTHTNFELIICNDCSTDDTVNIIKGFKDRRIHLIHNGTNLGYLLTFNKLLNHAKGEFITFLDADDLCTIDRLEKQLVFLRRNLEIKGVGTNFSSITAKGVRINTSDYPTEPCELYVQMHDEKAEFPFCGSSIMITSEIKDRIGGYREFFKGCPGEDIDWVLRISEIAKVANLSDACYLYRFHGESLTRRVHDTVKARHIEELIYYLDRQRLKFGKDDLMSNDSESLEKKIRKLEEPYVLDSSRMLRKMAFDYSVQKKWKNSYKFIFKAIRKEPIKFDNVKTLVLITGVLVLPVELTLKIRDLLKLKHISRDL